MAKKKAKELRSVPSMENDVAVAAWVNDTQTPKPIPKKPVTKKVAKKTPEPDEEKTELVAITYYASKEHAQAFRRFAFEADRSRSSIIYEEMEKFLERQ